MHSFLIELKMGQKKSGPAGLNPEALLRNNNDWS